ncbi:hypothetical protein LTS08_007663 [Lithohypha guttulata]|nr:hypothetical protein LTS08_007663 [Lithohypha guttulata]
MALTATQFTLLCVIGIILLARPAHAFGAGNIGSTSKIEGENWRHGDLEDILLTLVASKAMGGKKFSKLDVKRVYFGNWLRDYSQAVDVGTVKNVSAEAIRIVLWILGFMSFGYGTKEFEVTTERLGCYRPEEHIDNPKDYADNEDARDYDPRLRGPIDERRELAIDPELGLKAYIASENLGIDTSAGLVRKLFGRCIELGRMYGRNKNKADLHEALRLLGTGCHCLEDFSAHSNFVELALIELGERDVFPHVGRNCAVRLRGARSPVYPLVTGTFGGVDFLHSVTGEFDDKVTQSEIQELQGTLQNAQSQGGDTSALQDLLNKLPDGVFGGKDEAGKADELKMNAAQNQMQQTRVTPRQPEEWLQYIQEAQRQIYPIIEWHDEIPIIPDIIEGVQEQVNMFVFSLIAPFMLPIINQIKNELNTGSSTIIQSSLDKQHIVFSDDDSSDPTHSMLSKDHFSNVLNEPAGKIAGQVLKWVVPQIVQAWDDERIDVNQTLNRIIRGVFHHPALRRVGDDGAADGRALMFGIVERWWSEKSEREKDGLRDQLSRDGVEEGRNHKPGVKDHGHGSAKKIGMPNAFTIEHPGAPGGLGNLGSAGFVGVPGGNQATQQIGQFAGEAVGGGALGDIVGGLTGGLASAVSAGVMQGISGETPQTYGRNNRGDEDQYSGRPTSGNYGQPQYGRTDNRQGGYRQQSPRRGGGYSESRQEQQYSGGYGSESRRFDPSDTSSSGHRVFQSSNVDRNEHGVPTNMAPGYGSQRLQHVRDDDSNTSSYGRRRNDDDDNQERTSYGRRQGRGDDDDDNVRSSYGRRNDDDDDNTRSSYGRRTDESDGYGRRTDTESHNQGGYGRQTESSGYGSTRTRRDNDDDGNETFGSGGYGARRQQPESTGYGRREESGYESNTRYGQQDESYSSSGFGGGRSRTDEYDSNSGIGGGYGRSEGYGTQRSEGYSGREDRSEQYGRRSGGYGESESYGQSGGYGGRRRGGDDDDDNERIHPGGFPQDDDDDNERRGYGGNQYGRQEGYGSRRRDYDD